jgi:hypothetical protein
VLEMIKYDATVIWVLAPDRNGHLADVVLGFNSDEFVLTTEKKTLLGEIGSVTSRNNDFRQFRIRRGGIPLLFQNHDDHYPIRSGARDSPTLRPVKVARLAYPCSGRVLEMSITEHNCTSIPMLFSMGRLSEIRCPMPTVRRNLPRVRELSRRSQRTEPRRHHSAPWNNEQAAVTPYPCSENWRSDEKYKNHGSVHFGTSVPCAWNVQLDQCANFRRRYCRHHHR